MRPSFYIHDLSPIAIDLGPILIPWYWLFYFTGLLWCLYFGKYLIKKDLSPLYLNDYIDFLSRGFIIMIIGSRLFYALFYNLSLYFQNPKRILFIWEGGMSFHGAIISIALYALYLSRKKGINFFLYTDLISICIPIALFFGRIGNFINGELAGHTTQVPWAVIFPKLYDMNPRHPSQIYEAIFEGLITFFILILLKKKLRTPSFISCAFLFLYGFFRFFIEYFRLADKQLGRIIFGLSMGQILCLIMILSSFIIFKNNTKQRSSS